ncbi:MAG: TIGR03915 family putative DNA repair protein [Clostridiales Family XIII bacterium]|jgi:probable DNA metabolism protein|nr:TIGR03915 family putative DNA repair protein [Clostridiales Family XIII bacterium]
MNYIYDGTFEGFLTCVYAHYHAEKADGIAPASLPGRLNSGAVCQENLLTATRTIETDYEKAATVYDAIETKISKWDMERVYRVFKTNEDEKEMKLLRYIRFGFRRGPSIRLAHTHPIVLDIEKAERRISNEVHRLCGLIRFESVVPTTGMPPAITDPHHHAAPSPSPVPVPELLYSRIDPDNDVLEFLAPHFSDRFKSDPFIIHDERREKALVSFQRKWHITDFTEQDRALLARTGAEEEYKKLWRQYFDTIAIKERTNPKCQRTFMPARYWKNLPEINRPQ